MAGHHLRLEPNILLFRKRFLLFEGKEGGDVIMPGGVIPGRPGQARQGQARPRLRASGPGTLHSSFIQTGRSSRRLPKAIGIVCTTVQYISLRVEGGRMLQRSSRFHSSRECRTVAYGPPLTFYFCPSGVDFHVREVLGAESAALHHSSIIRAVSPGDRGMRITRFSAFGLISSVSLRLSVVSGVS